MFSNKKIKNKNEINKIGGWGAIVQGSRTIAPHTYFSVLCDKFLIGIVLRYTIFHRIC
jgi:hypothetical protein